MDTIAAVSTPTGEGGIAVVRLSGPESFALAGSVLDRSIGEAGSHRAYHGWILDGENPVDEAVLVFFRKPHSYTGEDTVEISCHGSPFIAGRILEILIRKGARLALPGEFSQRAFINGRMDLTQAEAVADLIRAKTEASMRVAVSHLRGALSLRIDALRGDLIRLCALLELELDFIGEDLELAPRRELQSLLEKSMSSLSDLLKTYRRGRVCRQGLRLAIVGRPNVGKSSLLNALLARERAIVTEVPGTTRDTVEEALDLEGLMLVITDTAGIRHTDDPIEKQGVERARLAMEEADIACVVLDGSREMTEEDVSLIEEAARRRVHTLLVVNKMDLPGRLELGPWTRNSNILDVLRVSALHGSGIRELIDTLKKIGLQGEMPSSEEVVLTRERHRDQFSRAESCLAHAQKSLEEGASQEFVAMDIRAALDHLGAVYGKTTPDDILNEIFSGFCVGK